MSKEIYSRLKEHCPRIQSNYSLAKLTTFNVGGPADFFAQVHTLEELHALLKAAQELQLPYFIIGGGSNLLISDAGIRGLVIKLAGIFCTLKMSADGQEIEVGAGITYPTLTLAALKAGWQNALGWNGTPGSVGGALRMNAGTRLGEISDTLVAVEGVSAHGVEIFPKSALNISYRHIRFPHQVILSRAWLKNPSAPVASDGLLAQAKELVLMRKNTQPKMRSAGSIFKNPSGNYAGRLIEEAGLKGLRVGCAEVSQVHANFIVNTGNATANDIYVLAKKVQEEVYAKFRISLEFELQFAGEVEFLH